MRYRSNGCVTLIVLFIIGLCCILGSCGGVVQASSDDCTEHGQWMLLIPGTETKIVSVWPGEGGYKIAKADGILIIWSDGENTASLRIGDDTFHGIVGLSYPETEYCGAIMIQLQEQFYIEDNWIVTRDA